MDPSPLLLHELACLHQGLAASSPQSSADLIPADDLPVGIHEIDTQGILRAVNQTECDLLGYPREALLGMPVWLLVHPNEREQSRQAVLAKLSSTHPLQPFRRQYQHASGRPVIVEVHETRLFDPKNQLLGIRTILIDVTERQDLAARLAESERRFRTIVEQMGEGICIFDCQETCTFSNAAADRSFGVPESSMVGRNLRDFVDELDWERVQEQSDLRSRGKTSSYELDIRQPSGELRTILVTGSPQSDHTGRRIGTFGILRDITERKLTERRLAQDEERFRSLAASVGDALVLTDANHRIHFWNRAAETVFGWTAEEALGKDFLEFTVPARFRPAFAEYYGHFCRTQGRNVAATETRELLGIHRSGRLIPVELSTSSFTLGDTWLALACIRDISRRKEAEYQLAKTTRRLEDALQKTRDANRAKGDFLASMSHEIRTPMNGILGMSGLLSDTSLNEEQRFFVGAIRSSATALLDIINDILDFSKIEARRIQLERVSFDLRTALEDTLDLVAPKAGEKQLELALAITSDVPHQVSGDPGRLRQVLLNLLGNAVKFTERGHVLLQVLAGAPANGTAWFTFEVHDTGDGIDPAQLPRLFERFTQADSSTTRRHGGTGLGLAIVRELTTLMGGTIEAESRPGQGSLFRLHLPLAIQPGPEAQASALDGRQILILDDSPIGGRAAAGLCRDWGMSVTLCDGVNSVRPEPRPEVVLVDSTFSRVALASLRDILPGVPFILMAGSHEGVQRARLRELGCQAMVFKPLKGHLVEAAILAQFGRQHPRHERQQAAAPLPSSLRALLVEDHHINQKLGVRLLEKLGCSVDIASNGAEAVEISARIPYDIIFMDCQMPEMDGYEATRRIRLREGSSTHTPIVAMTASAMAEDRARCLEAGMDDYISKPVVTDRLAACVRQWAAKNPPPQAW